MNPFRESAPPTVEYNKTEVELSRIREREETKRKIAVEKEKTKQGRPDGYYIVRGLAVLGAVLITLITSIAWYNVTAERVHAEHPASSCVETAEVITESTQTRSCPNGGWFDAHPTDKVGEILIRCHCGPKPPETAPASSKP